MKTLIFILFSSLFYLSSTALTIDLRLLINNGTLSFPGGQSILIKSYNQEQNIGLSSDILVWTTTDNVNLRIVNQDTISHNFTIEGLFNFGTIIPGDSAEQNIVITNPGVYRYRDDLNSPYQEYLGLCGIIHVKDPQDSTPYFYWDIHEFESGLNTSIINGNSPSLINYNPSVFTINGKSAPDINNDSIARITGNVGSEFRLVIMNNGLSIHSLHFHGYHLIVNNDSNGGFQDGRSKDTFAVKPEQHLVLSCVPDKEGEYPVHDHNLVAVTGGGQYGNGMFSTMLIIP